MSKMVSILGIVGMVVFLIRELVEKGTFELSNIEIVITFALVALLGVVNQVAMKFYEVA